MAFDAVVNKKDLNMKRLAGSLAERERDGWEVIAMFEQDGNTVQVFQNNTTLQQLLAEQKRTNELLNWLVQRLAAPAAS